MSIIYDALKKTQNTIEDNSKPAVEKKEPPSSSKPKVYLLYALVVSLGLFIGNTVFLYFTKTQKPKIASPVLRPQQLPEKIVTPPSRPIASTPREVRKRNQEEWALSGVFFSQDEGFCIINNQIVKVGDEVSQATVKRITMDEVELETAEGPVKLSTRTR